jgi:lysozyme
MQISNGGLVLTKSFEGLRLSSYQDQGGVWTIGYGSTSGVRGGMVITEVEATQRLRADMAVAEHCVNISVHVPLNQNQFDALVDFVFNAGAGAFINSQLRIVLNEGRYDEVPDQLIRWVHIGDTVNSGLTRRRKAEGELFSKVVASA